MRMSLSFITTITAVQCNVNVVKMCEGRKPTNNIELSKLNTLLKQTCDKVKCHKFNAETEYFKRPNFSAHK